MKPQTSDSRDLNTLNTVSSAAFLTIVVGLAGACAWQGLRNFRNFLSTTEANVVFVLWCLGVVAIVLSGLGAGYRALRTGQRSSLFLVAFLLVVSITFIPSPELSNWFLLDASVTFTYKNTTVGLNVVGLVLVAWHRRLKKSDSTAESVEHMKRQNR